MAEAKTPFSRTRFKQKTWYEYLIEQAFSLNPALIKFERASHEEVVDKFKKTGTC